MNVILGFLAGGTSLPRKFFVCTLGKPFIIVGNYFLLSKMWAFTKLNLVPTSSDWIYRLVWTDYGMI